jgi:glyoxylase-like metal-dependent hydrolase (beta-lactamase superfamily II)
MTEEIRYPGLDPRIRVFRHDEIVDTFVLVTDRYLIPVDTGTRPDDMLRVMEAVRGDLSGRALLVVNTHGDWDHVWGNSVFLAPDAPFPAPVLAHRLAAERMRGEDAEETLAGKQAKEPERYAGVSWWPPSVQVEGAARIEGGDLSIELIPTPGHTPDHYALWIPELRLLLAGDAAELPFPLVSGDGSLAQLRVSLHRMAALEPATVLCCHAPGVTSPDVLTQNMRYFDELERRCRERGPALLAGERPAETVGWPAEEAMPPGMRELTAEERNFYRRFHDNNIRATARAFFSLDPLMLQGDRPTTAS